MKVWTKGNTSTLLCEWKMVQSLWEILWRFLKKLKIELPDDPAVPLLDIYPQESALEERFALMFIVVLITIVKR